MMTCFDSPESDDGSGDGSSSVTSLKLPESRLEILSAVRRRSDIFVSSVRGSSTVN